MRLSSFTLLVLVAAAACRGREPAASGDQGGTMVIAVAADGDNLLPPLTVNATATEVGALVFEKLAEVGMRLNTVGDQGFEPTLASSWKWSPDSLSIAFALDPRAHWHDGRPVTAHDVRFTWQLYTDSTVGSPVGPLLKDIDSVTVRDSLTPVFWFTHRFPEQFLEAAWQMYILPEHLLASIPRAQLKSAPFGRQPVGSGPYRLRAWSAGQSLDLVADTTYHRGRAHIDRVIFSISPDYASTVLRLLSGEADMVEYLRPDDIAKVKANAALKIVPYPSLAYNALIFNEKDPADRRKPHPLFANRDLRRALAMAVDRRRAVRSVFDTLNPLALGHFTHQLFTFDSTVVQIPYAPDSARAILDRLGWTPGSDGVRRRQGVPLRFTIIVPSSSTPRQQLAVIIQDMLKQVGVQAEIEKMDFPTFVQTQTARKFDAAMAGFGIDPSPSSIRQTWSVAGSRAADGTNWAGYENPTFDALVDTAAAQFDPAKMRAAYKRAYDVMNADAPAIWLYEVTNIAGMHRRIHPTGMRADAWWVHIPQWTIPPGERIARDKLPLADARH